MDSATVDLHRQLIICIKQNEVEQSRQLITQLKQKREDLTNKQLTELMKHTESRNISSEIRRSLITELIEPNLDDLELNTSHPLWICVGSGDIDSLQLLFNNHEFDLNAAFAKKNRATLLHQAVHRNYKCPADCIKILDLLLIHGADVNAENSYGESVLLKMIGNNFWRAEVADYLLYKGASLATVNEYGRSPLNYAISSGEKDRVEWLMNHDIDIHKEMRKGEPLILAVLKNNEPLAKFFLEQGVDTNQKFVERCTLITPLHVVCREFEKPETGMLKLLLQFGVRFDILDHISRTAFQIAVDSHNEPVIMCLIEEYAKIKFQKEMDPSLEVTNLLDVELIDQHLQLKLCYDSCYEELKKMNSFILCKSISLYEALFVKKNHQLALLLKNKEFAKCFYACNKNKTFPLYQSVLNDKIKEAGVIKKAMDQLDEKLYSAISSLFPSVVIRIILKYLYRYELGF